MKYFGVLGKYVAHTWVFFGMRIKYSLLANLRKVKSLILVSCWQFFVMLCYEQIQNGESDFVNEG